MANKVNLTGFKVGRLTVIKENGLDKHGKVLWLCKCKCGQEKIIRSQPLHSGLTKSCGCIHKEILLTRLTKHGLSKKGQLHPLYNTWSTIKQRCLNPNHTSYPDYGGRGIIICDKWRDSFQLFLNDMGERPSVKHTIDRKDNDKGYSPENCRWATSKEQSRNKRNNIWIEVNDTKLIIADWALLIGITQEHLLVLLKNHSIQEIISKYGPNK